MEGGHDVENGRDGGTQAEREGRGGEDERAIVMGHVYVLLSRRCLSRCSSPPLTPSLRFCFYSVYSCLYLAGAVRLCQGVSSLPSCFVCVQGTK